jgi:uncharacterized protein YcfJ
LIGGGLGALGGGLVGDQMQGQEQRQDSQASELKQIAASYNGNVKNLMLSAVIVTALRARPAVLSRSGPL